MYIRREKKNSCIPFSVTSGSPWRFIKEGMEGPKISASRIPTRFLRPAAAKATLTMYSWFNMHSCIDTWLQGHFTCCGRLSHTAFTGSDGYNLLDAGNGDFLWETSLCAGYSRCRLVVRQSLLGVINTMSRDCAVSWPVPKDFHEPLDM